MVQSKVSLENVILEEKLKEFAHALDDDVMRVCLVESGWTEVNYQFKSKDHAVDVITWIGEHFKNNTWSRLGSYYVFKNKKDAEWFILRWV